MKYLAEHMETHLCLPEQVVAVAANVEEAAMGGRVVQTSTGDVQGVVNLRDLLEIDSFFSSN